MNVIGVFPSRILPHLLLGDIGTANNVGLLKALGVTHILSIGIRPNHTDSSMTFKFVDNIEDDGYGDLLSRFHECNAFIGRYIIIIYVVYITSLIIYYYYYL
jgi:dual specificity MAP kinase phosphatase